jgi:hypothetical protein
MILIADSGASITHWRLLNENGDVIAWFANAAMIDKLKDKAFTNNARCAVLKDNIPNANITGIYYRKSTKNIPK